MKVLVTAGPTREYLDPVRYLTNASSGTMGYALAEAARALGHDVILISGPTTLEPPGEVEFVGVVSARDMHREVLKRYAGVDLVVMNAAVCDYRPRRTRRNKIKRTESTFCLELVANPDILKTLGERKKHQRLMGFALETTWGIANARKKLVQKNLDWIVLNSASAIGAERVDATLVAADGRLQVFENVSKKALARRLIRIATG